MSHILRPPSEKTFNIADALAGIPRCLRLLEAAVLEYVSNFADDARRVAARDLARSLSQGCPECGFRGSSAVLQKLQALLGVPPGTVPELHRSMADRLVELLGLLKAQAQPQA